METKRERTMHILMAGRNLFCLQNCLPVSGWLLSALRRSAGRWLLPRSSLFFSATFLVFCFLFSANALMLIHCARSTFLLGHPPSSLSFFSSLSPPSFRCSSDVVASIEVGYIVTYIEAGGVVTFIEAVDIIPSIEAREAPPPLASLLLNAFLIRL